MNRRASSCRANLYVFLFHIHANGHENSKIVRQTEKNKLSSKLAKLPSLYKIKIMLNKIYSKILFLGALTLNSVVAYAAANTSLWGTVDEPVAPIQQIEQEQKQLQDDQIAEQKKIENQKTVCELLSAQANLYADSDKANIARINEALQNAYKAVLPDYKILLSSSDAANALYAKYRDLYIKTYCVAGSN